MQNFTLNVEDLLYFDEQWQWCRNTLFLPFVPTDGAEFELSAPSYAVKPNFKVRFRIEKEPVYIVRSKVFDAQIEFEKDYTKEELMDVGFTFSKYKEE